MAKKPGSEFIEQQKAAEALKQTTTDEVAARLLQMQFEKENREVREAEAATMRFLEEERRKDEEIRQKRLAEKQKEEEESFKKFMEEEAAKEAQIKRETEEVARRFEAEERAERQRKEKESFKKFMEEEAAKEAQIKRETEEVARRFEAEERAERQRKEKEAEEILYLQQAKEYMDEFIRKEMNTLAEVRTEKALKWGAFTQSSSGSSSSSSSSPSKSSGVKISLAGQEVLNLLQDSLGSFTKGSLVSMGYSLDAVNEAYMALGDNNVVALTDFE